MAQLLRARSELDRERLVEQHALDAEIERQPQQHRPLSLVIALKVSPTRLLIG
jgi:hypothetical protein